MHLPSSQPTLSPALTTFLPATVIGNTFTRASYWQWDMYTCCSTVRPSPFKLKQTPATKKTIYRKWIAVTLIRIFSGNGLRTSKLVSWYCVTPLVGIANGWTTQQELKSTIQVRRRRRKKKMAWQWIENGEATGIKIIRTDLHQKTRTRDHIPSKLKSATLPQYKFAFQIGLPALLATHLFFLPHFQIIPFKPQRLFKSTASNAITN